jgi:hypothetical protein
MKDQEKTDHELIEEISVMNYPAASFGEYNPERFRLAY